MKMKLNVEELRSEILEGARAIKLEVVTNVVSGNAVGVQEEINRVKEEKETSTEMERAVEVSLEDGMLHFLVQGG